MRQGIIELLQDNATRLEVCKRYKNVFNTREGQYVLGHLLRRLGFFNSEISDLGMVECRNVATEILMILSGIDDTELTNAIVQMATTMKISEDLK